MMMKEYHKAMGAFEQGLKLDQGHAECRDGLQKTQMKIYSASKKFLPTESVSGSSQVKTSVQRAIKKKILAQYPSLEAELDIIFPKRTKTFVVKCKDHINIVVAHGEAWFFNIREGPYFPTLKLLHKFPDLLPTVQVDKGAIRFVMRGADVMCRGLTSPGGNLDTDVEADMPVCILAEGKKMALGLALTKMSTMDMKTKNDGIGLTSVHYIGDGLWHCERSFDC